MLSCVTLLANDSPAKFLASSNIAFGVSDLSLNKSPPVRLDPSGITISILEKVSVPASKERYQLLHPIQNLFLIEIHKHTNYL